MTELAQRGVVDGVVGPTPEVTHELGISQYIKAVTRTSIPLYSSAFSSVVSEQKWAEISPEDQAAILNISGEALSAFAGEKYDERNDASAAKEDASGITIVEASDDFYQKLHDASEPLVQDWVEQADAKGIAGRDVLDFYRSQIGALSEQ